MKRIVFFAVLMIITLTGCERHPYADFSVNTTQIEPFENVYFTNLSENADSYYWDFGDGYTSEERAPSHYYDQEGTYTVTLTASNHESGSDVAQITLDVYYTLLEVTVADWNADYIPRYNIPNAFVTLYETYDDWYNYTNPIETRITNSGGVAIFPDVDPIIYYIDVQNQYYNNEQLGLEDIGFIETLPLENAQYNTFLAWVDPVDPIMFKSTGSSRLPLVSTMEKRSYKRVEVPK